MKNLEKMEGLWRDPPKQVLLYAICFGALLFCALYGLIIQSRLDERDALLHTLSRLKKEAPAWTLPTQEVQSKECPWEITADKWELQGSFAYVYDCLSHSVPHDLRLSSVMLKEHVLGVSATLILSESKS